MKNILYLFVLFITATATICTPVSTYAEKGKHKSAQPQPFSVKGDIGKMPPQTVVLELLRANDSIKVVDSQFSGATGHFEFKGTVSEPGLYRLRFIENKFILLSIDKGDINVTSAWPILNYEITGQASSVELKTFIDTVMTYITGINKSSGKIDSVRTTGNVQLIAEAEKKRTDAIAQYGTVVKSFCEKTTYQPNAMIAVRLLNPKDDYKFYESFDKMIDKKFPGSTPTVEFHQYMSRLKDGLPEPSEIGDKAPELQLSDTSGKIVSISSFRGKYVLVDFWASWCGPCRAENPNVVAAYKKYKDKNFAIFGISLDNNKDMWLKAINKDGLVWQHASDLKGWQSGAAAKYGVHAIPSNFLVDPKGVIVGKNLRGQDLENKLEELLKK